MINSDEILRLLDSATEGFEFPMLDNGYYYHGDQKLSIYRNEKDWAILIEILAYNNHNDGIDGIRTIAHVFGNCKGCFNDNNNFHSFASDNGIRTFLYDEIDYVPYLNSDAKSIRIKEAKLKIILDRQYYTEKNIELEFTNKITAWEFMRGLIPEHSNLFWLTRKEISDKIPLELPLFMTLDNWYHPDIANMEKPSETETFQQLAKVIVTGDKSFYNTKEKSNTHWSNWPNGGAL